MTYKMVLFSILLFSSQGKSVESSQDASITRLEGEVHLLIAKANLQSAETHTPILIEGMEYYMRNAKRGDRPKSGDIIKTGTAGKARLIFRNGDFFTVVPSTAYKISWDKNNKNPLGELIFGGIRGMILKGGPRSGLEIQTKSSVMGVRGTDFYVSAWSREGGSKISVIQGKVAVVTKGAGVKAKPVEVVAGSSGVVTTAVNIKPVTKQELVLIQNGTKVPKTEPSKIETAADKELAALEKKSVTVALQEVKIADPETFKAIKDNADADAVQSVVVKKLFIKAPEERNEPKPTLQDLENGGDIYEKYKWRE